MRPCLLFDPDGTLVHTDHLHYQAFVEMLARDGRSLTLEAFNRTIVGVAYWFPHQSNVSSALLFDYDGQTFDVIPSQPKQQRIAVHGLISF